MISRRFFAFVFAVAFFSFFIVSCSKSKNQIQLQKMTADELSPSVEWALVTDPYVACREQAGYEFPTVASFRKGEIYEVEGNKTVEITDEMPDGKKNIKKETWYALENGWVPGSAVRIFSNKMKAENAKENWK